MICEAGTHIVGPKSGWMLGNGRALVFMSHLCCLNYKLQTTEMYI
jgi:hypothetical protein